MANNLKRNLLICGDNLNALDDLKKQGIKADLIYLDPPFFSNKQYEVVWGDEAEVRSFKDRWAGGIKVYIKWIKERVVKMYDVLKDTGSFYLHCDWHASHYLKVMLDEIFGYHNFRNEVIWYYQTGGASPRRFSRKHDTILFYSKTDKWFFYSDAIKIKRTEKALKRAQTPQGARISKNDIYKNPDDVLVIPQMNPMAKERLGYPTQKPEALLERIIKASSSETDLVLDPFCGCGTTMAIAQMLRRKWIGMDISPTAVKLIEKRLDKLGAVKSKDFDVIGMPTTIEELKALEPFEFQNWVINEMRARQSKKRVGDMGLNGYYEKTIFIEEAGIQVKQSEKVGRNVIDNFETALKRADYRIGFIVAFSFTKGANEEAARVKEKGLDIQLIKVKDLLLGKVKI